ncbi:MAG: HD domain-containing protein [Desulfobacter sp.]|nr:MAG: HD domain-containing protein [Desulfobacter sp.]
MLTTGKLMSTVPEDYPLGQAIGVTTGQYKNIRQLLNRRSPGLMRAARKVIETSEFKYCNDSREDSFLWQHTVYVASLAMTLSYREGVDPLFPVITALFHDCGKFENGKFHAGKAPEEEAGAQIACKLLARTGFSREEALQVQESILALHNDKKRGDINTRIVNDADFLIKFGHMGFANFFEKSVLRGMAIRNSILRTLSKELTYAAALETRMYTRSGKDMARKKAGISISLFRNYLEELRITGISEYEIRRMDVNWGTYSQEIVRLYLVLPRFCEHCWNPLAVGLDREKGIKRDRLVVNIDCAACNRNNGYDFSFCLPEPTVH